MKILCKNEKVSSDLRFHSKYRDEKNGLMFLKNAIFLQKNKFLPRYVFTANAEMSRDEKNALVGKSFFSSTLSQQKKRSRQYRLTFLRDF